jgi:hypothetical protein
MGSACSFADTFRYWPTVSVSTGSSLISNARLTSSDFSLPTLAVPAPCTSGAWSPFGSDSRGRENPNGESMGCTPSRFRNGRPFGVGSITGPTMGRMASAPSPPATATVFAASTPMCCAARSISRSNRARASLPSRPGASTCARSHMTSPADRYSRPWPFCSGAGRLLRCMISRARSDTVESKDSSSSCWSIFPTRSFARRITSSSWSDRSRSASAAESVTAFTRARHCSRSAVSRSSMASGAPPAIA